MASRLTIQPVDLGAEDDDDNPLSIAIEMGNLRIVERCLKDGWPLHLENKMGYNPLQQAASDGNMEIVSFLVRRGADPNARNKWGLNALHRAAHNGHSDVVMFLLENGGDVGSVNDGGNSALHWAAYFGHYQVCTMLLTEGSDPLLKNKKGITPLEHAKSRKKLKCERILRSYAEGKMKPRRKISRKPKTPKVVMKPVTDEDLGTQPAEEPAQEKPLPTPMTYSEPTYTEVIDLTVQATGEFPEGTTDEAKPDEGVETAEGEGKEEEVVVADETKVVVTEASPEASKDVGEQAGEGVTVVEAPFVQTEEEKLYQKLDIGDIGEKPEPLDMEELAEEPSQTLLPLRAKKQPRQFANTPRLTPRMKMFTPMKGGTPADLSRAASGMSIASAASDRTIAYRNVDHKGDKLYSKAEITKQYKGDYQTMVLELTALKAENMQLVKEGEVLTSEIQRWVYSVTQFINEIFLRIFLLILSFSKCI